MIKIKILLAIFLSVYSLLVQNSATAKTLFSSPKPIVDSTLLTRRQTVSALLEEGETLLLQGEVKRAIVVFNEAEMLSPTQQIPALSWNSLCWYGSLWGQASDVLSACDKAVQLEPEAEEFRDSRGLARALTGNINGAIEDFQAFINSTEDQDRKIERQGWINMLRQGKNPFTPEQIRLLFRD